MSATTLIVPGFHGSGPGHWQTWMESRVGGARRVAGIDWESPVLETWAAALRHEIRRSPGPVWLVAHSFGCLVAVVAGAALADRVAGALLVAPADPDRFSALGLREDRAAGIDSLAASLPRQNLGFPSLVVASGNDPWMTTRNLTPWSEAWGSRLIGIGQAGHINTESGFGPWPMGLALLHLLQDRTRPVSAPHTRRRTRRAGEGSAARRLDD